MYHKHLFTLHWMLLAAGMVILAFVIWQHGLFHQLFHSDVSRLSSIILLVFLIASFHAAFHLFRFSRDTEAVRQQDEKLKRLPLTERFRILSSGQGFPSRLKKQLSAIASRYESMNSAASLENTMLMQMLDNQIKAPVRLGWLLSDLLIKLGLLGTVIGFILMLGAISDGGSVDSSNIDVLLTDMGSGMRVALFTTLTGLTTGTVLGFQYFIVERSADVLMARVTELVELRLTNNIGDPGSE
jgi:hypothetical protein